MHTNNNYSLFIKKLMYNLRHPQTNESLTMHSKIRIVTKKKKHMEGNYHYCLEKKFSINKRRVNKGYKSYKKSQSIEFQSEKGEKYIQVVCKRRCKQV